MPSAKLVADRTTPATVAATVRASRCIEGRLIRGSSLIENAYHSGTQGGLPMSKRMRSFHWLLRVLAVGLIVFGAALWQQAALAIQAPAPVPPAHAPHWSYEGAQDPSHWAELSPDFALCGAGHQQSPIDIVTSAA